MAVKKVVKKAVKKAVKKTTKQTVERFSREWHDMKAEARRKLDEK